MSTEFSEEDYELANSYLKSRWESKSTPSPAPSKPRGKRKGLSEHALFMADYLKQHMSCNSWDFDADVAFARKFGTLEEQQLIKDTMRSSAPFSMIVAAWQIGWEKPITQKRLKALRELVREGYVEAQWVGLGEGAMNIWGRSRVRGYFFVHHPNP